MTSKKDDKKFKIGDVFLDSAYGKHRYFIVGQDNNRNKVLVVMATSKCDKKFYYADKKNNFYTVDSIVKVQKDKYQSRIRNNECSLIEETCFDCNDAEVKYLNNMEVIKCSPLSKELLSTLQEACKQSLNIEKDVMGLMD